MSDKEEGGDLTTEYDIRQSRVLTVGKLTEELALQYRETLLNLSRSNLNEYYADLKTLYKTIKYYSDKDTKEETEEGTDPDEIEEKLGKANKRIRDLKSSSTKHELRKILELLEDAEDKINSFRLDIGLDLPTSTDNQEGPEEWY